MFESPLAHSILRKAQDKGLISIRLVDLRDYSAERHRVTDDYPYGGGAGMVMMIEPIDKCISQLKSERNYDEIIYMTPDGETLNQGMANAMSLYENKIGRAHV